MKIRQKTPGWEHLGSAVQGLMAIGSILILLPKHPGGDGLCRALCCQGIVGKHLFSSSDLNSPNFYNSIPKTLRSLVKSMPNISNSKKISEILITISWYSINSIKRDSTRIIKNSLLIMYKTQKLQNWSKISVLMNWSNLKDLRHLINRDHPRRIFTRIPWRNLEYFPFFFSFLFSQALSVK